MSILMGDNRSVGAVLAGVATGDLMARFLPELLGLSDNFLLPVGLVIASGFVLDMTTVSWLLGWLLFGIVVFQISPLLFPRYAHRWAHALPNRLTMTVSSVTAGMFIEKFILDTLSEPQLGGGELGTTPLPLPLDIFPVVLLGITILLVGSKFYSNPTIHSRFVYSFDADRFPASPMDRLPVTQHVTLVLLIGTLLAELSLLFPLPELLIIAAFGYDFGGFLIGGVEEIPARQDLAERVLQAGTAIWHRPRKVIQLFYIVFGIFAILFMDLFYIKYLDLPALVQVRPVAGAFAVYVLVMITTLGSIAYVRFAERIPAQLHSTPGYRVSDKHRRQTPPEPDRQSVPGLLVPAGIILMTLELARPNYADAEAASELPALLALKPLFTVAIVAGLVGIAMIWWPDLAGGSLFSDYVATPLAVGCFLTIGWGIGFMDFGKLLADQNVASVLVEFFGLVLNVPALALAPFIGYELAPLEDGEGLLAPIIGIAILLVIFFVGGVGAFVITGGPETLLGTLTMFVFVAGLIVGIVSIAVRLFLLGFYFEGQLLSS